MTVDQNTPPGNEPVKQQDKEDRGGPLGWLYRRYQQFDKWKGRYDWLQWLLKMFKTHTATSVAVTSTTAVVAVGGAVVMTTPELREKWLPVLGFEQALGEQTVTTERWGSSVVFPIEGKDLEGRKAAFDVAVLPQDLTWAHQSSSILAQGGTRMAENEVPDRVFSPELRQGLARSGAVMAVGLASQEGRRQDEVARASRRAVTAASWLNAVVEDDKTIWTLNLGQYRGDCKAASGDLTGTAWQRPLIVVGIREQEDDVNLSEAFADAISDKTNLPSRDCYTNFDLAKYR